MSRTQVLIAALLALLVVRDVAAQEPPAAPPAKPKAAKPKAGKPKAAQPKAAQPKAKPKAKAAPAAPGGTQLTLAQRAVDMVSLTNGDRFLGMLAGPPAGGRLTFFVSRDWLRNGLPRYYKTFADGERESTRNTLEQTRDFIVAWRERRKDKQALAAFLGQKLADIEKHLADLDDPQYELPQILAIDIAEADVHRHHAQQPATRRLLGWAWEQRLPDAEERAPGTLRKRLVALGVDPDVRSPDLTDRLAPVPQSDEAWAARVAVVEYQVIGEPHYQGMGDALVQAGKDAELAGMRELLKGMMAGQVEGQLAELLGTANGEQDEAEEKAVQRATSEAQAANFYGVRVTQLAQDAARGEVRVTVRILARMPDDTWRDVWRGTTLADANNPRPEAVKKLAQNPQVKKAIAVIKGLGVPIDPSLLDKALRHGAATQEALDGANAAANEFLLAGARRFDGPPLSLLDPSARP
jgi:flavin-binding protein dodecin